MLAWLTENLGTILISLLLLAVVALVIVKLRRDKKSGGSVCCGDCRHCAMHDVHCGKQP